MYKCNLKCECEYIKVWINKSEKAKNSIRITYKNFDKNFDECFKKLRLKHEKNPLQ